MLLDPECEGERPWREDELPVLLSLRGEVVSVLSVVVFDVVVFLCFLCFFLCVEAVLFSLLVDELVPVAVSLPVPVDEPLIDPLPVAASLLPVAEPVPLEPVSVPDRVLDPVVAVSSRSWSRSVELEPIEPLEPLEPVELPVSLELPVEPEPIEPEPEPEPVLVLLLPVPALPPPLCAYAGLANSAAAAMMPMSFFMRGCSFVEPTLAARCPQGGGEEFAPRNVGTRPALRYPA